MCAHVRSCARCAEPLSRTPQGVLKYFKSKGDKKEAGVVDCQGATIERTGEHTFSVHTALRVLVLRAADPDDVEMWIDAIETEFSLPGFTSCFHDEEAPPPTGSELALEALKRLRRAHEFGALLTAAKRLMPRQPAAPGSDSPSIGESEAAADTLAPVERGDDFGMLLGAALERLTHTGIPAMVASRAYTQTGEATGFHMYQGAWWPESLPSRFVERLGSFWHQLTVPPVDLCAEGEPSSSPSTQARVDEGVARAAAYEAGEIIWRGDEGNATKAAAAKEGFSFLIHSVHTADLSESEMAALEAARAAAVKASSARAALYEAADAAGEGLIDWSKVKTTKWKEHKP